ncbi:YARHG domain-containing protein [Flavobacterium sp. LPB0248]|uniref:YARHG domain-containing protein n=1 Tax=Flavobacterium sp. LPB0248 TaxID=2614441 RepID=UPI0015A5911C|nr:YARHG domain-containing protein [Flavobacterium sp. LPB0248]QLC67096.1 YARHG domain-containing protein [Flavobacterium sp. LPB0248]
MIPAQTKTIKIIISLTALLFLQASFGQTLKDCSTCKTQLIKKEQVKNLNVDNIRLLTNEIFARNGYMFENSRFQEYFENKSWYKSVGDNKKVVLNDIEKKNLAFFKDVTKTLEDQKKELTSQLKNFKELVFQDKISELQNAYNFSYEKGNSEEKKLLKEVFRKINLNDINYYKSKGMFKTIEDNGFVQIEYMVYIENDEVTITYNYMAHSKIIEDFDEYTDYLSENEFSYNWQFKFTRNKLNYIRLAVAG